MKPRVFIGSSGDNLDIAYGIQEALTSVSDPTVWTQNVFDLSRSTMESLMDRLDETDYAAFIFAPSDVTEIKDEHKLTVRDNVIFELGLFIGRLGRDRCFIVMPQNITELHLPSDLLGITAALYDAKRSDGNINAALGPACNRIRQAIAKNGPMIKITEVIEKIEENKSNLLQDQTDCENAIRSYIINYRNGLEGSTINFNYLDRELNMAPRSSKKYFRMVAVQQGYHENIEGDSTIFFPLTANF